MVFTVPLGQKVADAITAACLSVGSGFLGSLFGSDVQSDIPIAAHVTAAAAPARAAAPITKAAPPLTKPAPNAIPPPIPIAARAGPQPIIQAATTNPTAIPTIAVVTAV